MRSLTPLITHILPAVFLLVSTWVLLPEEARAGSSRVQETEATSYTSPARTSLELPRGLAYYGAWGTATKRLTVPRGMTYDDAVAETSRAASNVATGIILMVVFGIGIPVSIAWALNVPIIAAPVSVAVCSIMFVVGLIMVIAGSVKLAKIERELRESMLIKPGGNRAPSNWLAHEQTFHGVELPTPRGLALHF